MTEMGLDNIEHRTRLLPLRLALLSLHGVLKAVQQQERLEKVQ